MPDSMTFWISINLPPVISGPTGFVLDLRQFISTMNISCFVLAGVQAEAVRMGEKVASVRPG